MSESTLIDRLQRMEKGHKDNGMMYEGEVCFRAVERIKELEAQLKRMRQGERAADQRIAELERERTCTWKLQKLGNVGRGFYVEMDNGAYMYCYPHRLELIEET